MSDHNTPAIVAFAQYIFAYDAKKKPFSTSWTTCATCEEPEEQLLDAAAKDYSESETPDYLATLPTLVIYVCLHHAKKRSEVNAALAFLTDAVTDLTECHLRDSSLDVEEDAA